MLLTSILYEKLVLATMLSLLREAGPGQRFGEGRVCSISQQSQAVHVRLKPPVGGWNSAAVFPSCRERSAPGPVSRDPFVRPPVGEGRGVRVEPRSRPGRVGLIPAESRPPYDVGRGIQRPLDPGFLICKWR